ncbi:LapA family protein [Parvularcula dongshanensis]|uniref:Putative integral membrane protein n=1 Tax=Parvularcula dongshanensis TaxID=1173995 RepID=A0A840I1X0_9PROT|nr:LapA family protein [Parvularcula dongshanensis]MBB4658252.1 putative integral membrane protein [Parvularcula dongshanensis]
MRRALTLLVLFVLGVLLAVFLTANSDPVTLSMDPFSKDAPAVSVGPISLAYVLLIPLFLGFVLGGFGMWLSGGKARTLAKERQREVRRLREELREARSLKAPQHDGVLVPVGQAGPGETPTGLPSVRA